MIGLRYQRGVAEHPSPEHPFKLRQALNEGDQREIAQGLAAHIQRCEFEQRLRSAWDEYKSTGALPPEGTFARGFVDELRNKDELPR